MPSLLALTAVDIANGIWYGLVFVLMISLLVAAHEYGHYLFARVFKMGVEEFAIGFGRPKIKTWLRKTYSTPEGEETTDFTLRAWPIGGFVRIKGMMPEEDGSEVNVPGGFYHRAPWQRFIVLAAGPVFSIIFGVLLLAGVYSIYGVRQANPAPIIGQMDPKGPAYLAGLRLGDKIVSVDGKPTSTFYEVIVGIRTNGGVPIPVEYERDGKRAVATVTPILSDQATPVIGPDLQITNELKKQGRWFAQWSDQKVRLGFGAAVVEAAKEPVRAVTGLTNIVKKPQSISDNLSGPGTMVLITSAMVQQGFEQVVWLAGMLSISVGILNLLPVHPLDGGQMLVAFTEMLRGGRRLSFKVQNIVSAVGLVFVMLLFAGALMGDVKNIQRVQQMNNEKPAPK
ncbi:MAG: M50 family metallopeptidase [Fimbriimonas sp.]